MKTKLTFKETVAISSMLFGMFFGAGNLIFPVHMGQLAGAKLVPALIGFIITGVGLPLLGVAALAAGRCSGLLEMSERVGKGYGLFFTCLLYLTIGPCFAIPRCATTSFTVGLESLAGTGRIALFIFSAVFFMIVVFFSLKPQGIMTWIGKILNPAFLVFFGILILTALLFPAASVSDISPDASYSTEAFFNGFIEGYNTMDALAGLAFGIVVVNVIRGCGIEDPSAIASNAVRAGSFSCLFMAVIYSGAAIAGAQSRGAFELSENGGIALAQICAKYFGSFGSIFLAITVTLACLKTAIGLVTSISESFSEIFTGGRHYSVWAVSFCVFAFIISNVGLSTLIEYAVPVLLFLYPLAVTLILLSLAGRYFDNDRRVYVSVTVLTLVAAVLDLGNALGIEAASRAGNRFLPFFSLGLGWILPAVAGLLTGLVLRRAGNDRA